MIKSYKHTITDYENILNPHTALLTFETTGINKNKNSIYLISILGSSNNTTNSLNIMQLLCTEKHYESYLLNKCIDYLKSFDSIILYNIKNFHLSFFQKRLEENNIQFILPNIFDIYNFLYSKKNIININNFKKDTLEDLIEYKRNNALSSIQALNLYKKINFDNLKESEEIKKLLNFNIENTLMHYKAYTYTDILKQNLKLNLFLSNQNDFFEFFIDSINFKDDILNIRLISDNIFLKLFFEYEMFSIESVDSNINIKFKTTTAYLNASTICIFHDIGYINRSLKDKTNFDTPNGVLLLKVGDSIIVENIKLLLEEIFKEMK